MFLKSAHIGKNQWWRYLLTILLVITGTVIGQLPLYFFLMAAGTSAGFSQFEVVEMMDRMDFQSLDIGQNTVIFLMLLSFVFALLSLWAGVRIIHNKPFRILITPRLKIDWSRVFFAFAFWMGLTVLAEFIFFLMDPGLYEMQFQPGQFIVLLLISLLILPLQTSFEEIFFRGYLMQGISLVSRFRWVPLLLTSVFFGSMHWMNPEVEAFGTGITMVYYIGVGLFLGILTLMDDSLELALGIHAATNIYGALFVTFDESAIQTAAIFHNSEVDMELMLAGFLIAAGVFLYVAARKYGWSDWTRCYGSVSRPDEPDPAIP